MDGESSYFLFFLPWTVFSRTILGLRPFTLSIGLEFRPRPCTSVAFYHFHCKVLLFVGRAYLPPADCVAPVRAMK